jgi:hypothetical protein
VRTPTLLIPDTPDDRRALINRRADRASCFIARRRFDDLRAAVQLQLATIRISMALPLIVSLRIEENGDDLA